MKLLWTTDLHLMNIGGKHRSGVDPAVRLRACLDDMLAEHADAARLIITGDLIQLRHPGAYRLLAEALAEVPIPVRLLVGNHDDREALVDSFPELQLSGGFVQYAEQFEKYQLIYLDTLADDGKHFGQLSAERLAWLDTTLGASEGPALLFMHHPPAAVGIPALDTVRLNDGDIDLARILQRHRHRQPYLLCGHLHRNVSGVWRGTPFTVMTAPYIGFALRMQEQTLVAVDENPGYGVVLCSEEGVVIHTNSIRKQVATLETLSATR
ncbi:phosphodiesterase [Caballeronia jiangsuensis]|nr:phosphodiesterase [Caballeronia jiangsuensis]